MKGVVKLHIHRRFRHTERYRNMEERDGIIRRWIADFNLVTKPHYITIVPDEEEVTQHYEFERAGKFSGSPRKQRRYSSLEEAREKEAEIAAAWGTMPASAVDVGAAGGLVASYGHSGGR